MEIMHPSERDGRLVREFPRAERAPSRNASARYMLGDSRERPREERLPERRANIGPTCKRERSRSGSRGRRDADRDSMRVRGHTGSVEREWLHSKDKHQWRKPAHSAAQLRIAHPEPRRQGRGPAETQLTLTQDRQICFQNC